MILPDNPHPFFLSPASSCRLLMMAPYLEAKSVILMRYSRTTKSRMATKPRVGVTSLAEARQAVRRMQPSAMPKMWER